MFLRLVSDGSFEGAVSLLSIFTSMPNPARLHGWHCQAQLTETSLHVAVIAALPVPVGAIIGEDTTELTESAPDLHLMMQKQMQRL
jgi:hypothetical protein